MVQSHEICAAAHPLHDSDFQDGRECLLVRKDRNRWEEETEHVIVNPTLTWHDCAWSWEAEQEGRDPKTLRIPQIFFLQKYREGWHFGINRQKVEAAQLCGTSAVVGYCPQNTKSESWIGPQREMTLCLALFLQPEADWAHTRVWSGPLRHKPWFCNLTVLAPNVTAGMERNLFGEPIQCMQFAIPPKLPSVTCCSFWITLRTWSYVWCLNCTVVVCLTHRRENFGNSVVEFLMYALPPCIRILDRLPLWDYSALNCLLFKASLSYSCNRAESHAAFPRHTSLCAVIPTKLESAWFETNMHNWNRTGFSSRVGPLKAHSYRRRKFVPHGGNELPWKCTAIRPLNLDELEIRLPSLVWMILDWNPGSVLFSLQPCKCLLKQSGLFGVRLPSSSLRSSLS